MSESEHKIDRDGWPSGEWDDEPDRVEWRSEHGFPCLIVRNRMGALCGYVGVAPGHPWYEKDYNDVDAEAHGGLTYAERCAGHICHVPAPGEPDDVWWLGFDCAHAGDACPSSMAWNISRGRPALAFYDGHYKSVGYVRAETERLAVQARRAAQ
jgi:hypothetical protein